MVRVPALRSLAVLSACLLLALPFAALAWTSARIVEPWSRSAAEVLVQLSASLREAPRSPLESSAARPQSASNPTPAAKEPSPRSVRRPRPQTANVLFVSAANVLELAQGASPPRGAFVGAAGSQPAGLRLSGVAALGIGVEDGDILIEALGVEPRSPGQIIGVVLEARAKRLRYVSGTLWRRGQTLRIVVEQPYPEQLRDASAAGAPIPS